MRARVWVGCVAAVWLIACGGSTTSGGGAGTGGGAGGSGVCGGLAGVQCDAAKWCDFTPDSCGGGDQQGTCRPRPQGCAKNLHRVCGCDGKVYDNECLAQMAGVDRSEGGGCQPPTNDIPCGWNFCDGTTSYCEKSLSDTGGPDSYACVPLPDACKNTLDCGCFPSTTPCRDQCVQVFGNGLDGFVLTCPGG